MTILFLLLAGLCYGVQSHVWFYAYHYGHNVVRREKWVKARLVPLWWYEWWYITRSAWNKYYLRDTVPHRRPAFPGSTWVLVWITDAFHFFQMVGGLFLALAAVYYDLALPSWADHPAASVAVWIATYRTGFSIIFNGLTIMFNPKKLYRRFAALTTLQKVLSALAVGISLFFALAGIDMLLDHYTGSQTPGTVVVIALVVAIVGLWIYVVQVGGKK